MKCPNCGFETNEKYCPACGANMNTTKTSKGKTLAIIVLSVAVITLVCTNVITLVIFANIIFANKTELETVNTQPTTVISETVANTQATTSTNKSDDKDYIFVPGKNSTVKTGFGNIKLTNIEYAPANEEFSANYVYTLQKVTFEFENTSDSPKQLGYCNVTIPNDYPNLYPQTMQVQRIEYTNELKVCKSGDKMSVSMVLAVSKKESEVSFTLKIYSSTESKDYENTFAIERKD